MELLRPHGKLPVSQDNFFKFTLQSKIDLYLNYEQALSKERGDKMQFSYPADHPLAAEFEEQLVALLREYKADGDYLSGYHPEEPNAKDDAPDSTALAPFAAARTGAQELVFL